MHITLRIIAILLLSLLAGAQNSPNYFGQLSVDMGGQVRPHIIAGDWSEAIACQMNTWRPSIPDYNGKSPWGGDPWKAFEQNIRHGIKAGFTPYFVLEVSGNVKRAPDSFEIKPEFLDSRHPFSFNKFLTETLTRLADMCGDSIPLIIQAGNEPQAYSHAVRSYTHYLMDLYAAIKKIDPRIQVVNGASGWTADGKLDFLMEMLMPLTARCFDRQDIHWFGTVFGDYRLSIDKIEEVRSIFRNKGWGDIPIDMTENGTFTGSPWGFPWQSEQMQAADNLKRAVLCLSQGVRCFMLPMFLKESMGLGEEWSHHGLIFDGIGRDDRGDGKRKLGFYTFALMAKELRQATFLSADEPRPGIYRYRFKSPQHKVLDVLWYDKPQRVQKSYLTVDLGPYPAGTIISSISDYEGKYKSNKYGARPNLRIKVREFEPLFIESP